jgi:TIR domain-containing protein
MDVFISYSHQDHAWKDRVVTFMNCMRKQRNLGYTTWDDGEIHPSEDWNKNIGEAITQARVAVLLVSADFLSSDFINDTEVPLLLERRDQGILAVMPLVVRPCPWEVVDWLASIQLHPSEGTPLSSCGDAEVEEHLKQMALELDRLVSEARGEPEEATEAVSFETVKTDGFHLMDPAEIREFMLDRVRQEPLDELDIFRTKTQRTWLVTTPGRLHCLLDSRRTREANRVLQWQMPLGPNIPVQVRERSRNKSTGLIDVGKRQNWLYSRKRHKNPAILRERIHRMIETARHS